MRSYRHAKLVSPSLPSAAAYVRSASGYTLSDGTSMASPHVAGVAALLRSLYPEKSAAEIKGMILNGADGSVLKDGCPAHGRLDVCAAWKLGQTGRGDG